MDGGVEIVYVEIYFGIGYNIFLMANHGCSKGGTLLQEHDHQNFLINTVSLAGGNNWERGCLLAFSHDHDHDIYGISTKGDGFEVVERGVLVI